MGRFSGFLLVTSGKRNLHRVDERPLARVGTVSGHWRLDDL
jgi:hypothetical protein